MWEGSDYLPEVLDAWIADPSATFQAAELEGFVVGIQRLRPIAPKVVFYEGLRVSAEHRREGVARRMLRQAIGLARTQGFAEVRLVTANPHAARLFESEGFQLLVACRAWVAGRVEGGDPPRLLTAAEAESTFAWLRTDAAMRAYGGVNPNWKAVLDVDAGLLARLAGEGLIRTGPGGRGLAITMPEPRIRLGVTFAAGAGAALQELLEGLRYEADSLALDGVWMLAPEDHPAQNDFRAVGYDLGDDPGRPWRHLSYRLRLPS